MLDRAFHVQQHQHETAHHRLVGARPERLQGQGQADDHEEQHRAQRLGDHEGVDRTHLGVTDEIGGALDALDEHALAARTVDAQFLGAAGNGVVVLLQFVFGVAGGHETLDTLALRVELDAGADGNRQHHHQEHRPRQHRQVTHAAEGHGQGNRQRREGEGEVADGVDVVGQHRDQPVAAVALDLLDGRRKDFLPQRFAQPGNDVLANIVGADVGADRTAQSQQAQAAEQRDHALGQAVRRMQRVVDGGQQHRHAQATHHAQENGRGDDQSKRFQQGQ
ncbi:hypothetical protein D9M71_244580 [compost metagenome]